MFDETIPCLMKLLLEIMELLFSCHLGPNPIVQFSSMIVPNENLSVVHHNLPDPDLPVEWGSPTDQKL